MTMSVAPGVAMALPAVRLELDVGLGTSAPRHSALDTSSFGGAHVLHRPPLRRHLLAAFSRLLLCHVFPSGVGCYQRFALLSQFMKGRNRSGEYAARSAEAARGRVTRCWPSARSAADEAAARADEVDDDVFAQLVRGGEERAAVVDLGHVLDEPDQPRALLEHERVDRDVLARAALDFLQRLLDGALGRRVVEVGHAAFEMRGRLAVGHHEDLLVAAL